MVCVCVYVLPGQKFIPRDKTELLTSLTANRPTNFYVGVTQQTSEQTLLVQYLLANLTGSTINITQDNCQNQREDEEDKESKHVRFYLVKEKNDKEK